MSTRFINCEVCQTEGRILRSNGGPDEIDCGVCPACNGKCEVEVEDHSVALEDFDDYECENCLGMPEHGCYCKAVGAVAPGGPLKEPNINECRSCGRIFKDGETCPRGGCPMGGDF